MKSYGGTAMIELTRFNDTKFTLNADIIETIEETPDTVIALTTGKKIIVKESRQEVSDLVKLYRYEVFSGKNLG
jgi:flagellar protein FlbD